MPDIQAILDRMGHEGYRLTGPRRLVVEEVLGHQAPFTSAELWETMQEQSPGIGRATVFRTLDLLTRMGLVQRIHCDADSGRCHAYTVCEQTHHHHLICKKCGMVTDFTEDEELDSLVRHIEKRTSFHVEGHRLELVGVCSKCRGGRA